MCGKVRGAISEKTTGFLNKERTMLKILLLGGKKGDLEIEGPSELFADFSRNDEVEVTLTKIK